MYEAKFKEDDIVRVVRGPEKYRNKVMIIKGTTKEVWGFEDVNGSHKAFNYNPLCRYLGTDHPDLGVVYYARYARNLFKDCVHESWIEKDVDFDEDNIVVSASGGPTADGGYYTVYHTLGDMKKKYGQQEEAVIGEEDQEGNTYRQDLPKEDGETQSVERGPVNFGREYLVDEEVDRREDLTVSFCQRRSVGGMFMAGVVVSVVVNELYSRWKKNNKLREKRRKKDNE